jgi:hypothetical protein
MDGVQQLFRLEDHSGKLCAVDVGRIEHANIRHDRLDPTDRARRIRSYAPVLRHDSQATTGLLWKRVYSQQFPANAGRSLLLWRVWLDDVGVELLVGSGEDTERDIAQGEPIKNGTTCPPSCRFGT